MDPDQNQLSESISVESEQNGRFCLDLDLRRRLLYHQIAIAIAHIRILGEAGIIGGDVTATISHGLSTIAGELRAGKSFRKALAASPTSSPRRSSRAL